MISIKSRLTNEGNQQTIEFATNGLTHEITIPTKETGKGSSVNGGEALFLALAICYCNDIYREADRMGMEVTSVEVEVGGEFKPTPGAAAENIRYMARVKAKASEAEIRKLMRHTDTVGEIHNTLRKGVAVKLEKLEPIQSK